MKQSVDKDKALEGPQLLTTLGTKAMMSSEEMLSIVLAVMSLTRLAHISIVKISCRSSSSSSSSKQQDAVEGEGTAHQDSSYCPSPDLLAPSDEDQEASALYPRISHESNLIKITTAHDAVREADEEDRQDTDRAKPRADTEAPERDSNDGMINRNNSLLNRQQPRRKFVHKPRHGSSSFGNDHMISAPLHPRGGKFANHAALD
ncbi:hypothetical protein THAOC_13755 [Thalassiosira oceanica]|uniref:Uncharacterized protein n=1 Tax=Thalassiosira oceanica TaxID=159749 RepID=K0SK81_THAOC|nr:hypothetical protein THAOC_13755 [Thalassiosira oceanica]|eukprot:EJK65384.1 hypothetical protein THAOC_13755 [Thalassiosira oceanica]